LKIDVLYLCHGRRTFTEATLWNLIHNTNWSLVDRFVVYNDAAPDGGETTALLHEMLEGSAEIRLTNLGSPVGVMNHFVWRSRCEIFAKIDNDIMVPPGWLEAMMQVMKDDPGLELLGMEPGMSGVRAPKEMPACYSYMPSSHIGGVGLMRREAFERRSYPRPNGRFGFTEWQHRYRPVRGWIQPDLRMFALDQLPFEPWQELTTRYIGMGLNRDWPKYPADMQWYWEWSAIEGVSDAMAS